MIIHEIPSESDIFTLVRAFILHVIGADEIVVQGQQNYVPAPNVQSYVVMWPSSLTRLSTNESEYDSIGETRNVRSSMESTIQVDVHGVKSGEWAILLAGLIRDPLAVDFFKAGNPKISPLDATDPKQMPFMGGERTYENRWTFYLQLHLAALISTEQDFAGELSPAIIEVDSEYV